VEKKAVTAVTLFKLLKRRISQNAADQTVEEREEKKRKKKMLQCCKLACRRFPSFFERESFAKLGWGIIGLVTHKGSLC